MRRPGIFNAAYGTAPFSQATPMAAPLDEGLDTGSATQRKPLPNIDDDEEDEEGGAAALLRLLKLSEVLGGGE